MDVANRMIPAVFTALYCPVTSQPQKDDVEYPNGNWCSSVVGYQAQSFVQNMNFRCAAFVPVGKERAAMTLGDFTPNEDFVNSSIMFLTTGGATARTTFDGAKVPETYVYWTEDDEPEDGAGWYLAADDDATVNQNDKVVPFGQAFCVTRTETETDATLTTAGEVQDTPVTLSFVQNMNFVGNCSPVDLTLGDITPNEDFVNSSIMFLTTGGATARTTFDGATVPATYVYWTEDDEPEDGAGWYLSADDDATVSQNAVPVPAGQAFCVTRTETETDATLTIPAAITK